MPFDIVFLKDPDHFLITWTGDFTQEGVMEASEAMLSHPEFQTGSDRIWDLRKTRIDITNSVIQSIVNDWNKVDSLHGRRKCAIIVDDDLSFGMMRMYEMLRENLRVNYNISKNLDEATSWLKGK